MKIIDANKVRWLGGFGIGVVAAETFRDGSMAFVLLGMGILGRWFLGKIASTFFDEELTSLKKFFALKDPVKVSIWDHTNSAHEGKWQDCEHESCQV